MKRLAADERRATAALIASLAEVDARRLYLGEGCASLFAYCTRILHLSEHAAYTRIEAARTVRRFPMVLQRLGDADLTLTAVTLLRPHLTDENCAELLDKARHATKRDVEQLVADIAPRPDAPVMVRRSTQAREVAVVTIPTAAPLVLNADATVAASNRETPSGPPTDTAALLDTPSRPQVARVHPLAPDRYKVQFTVSRGTHDKLRRAQDLLRHAVPNGDPAEIFDRALTLLLTQLERTKLAQAARTRAPKAGSKGRHIPASVRRAVWARDGGRCAFDGREGRCGETRFLEFHHVVPFARGGAATVGNVQLRCRAHNNYEAVKEFGDRALFVKEGSPPDIMDSFWTEFRDPAAMRASAIKSFVRGASQRVGSTLSAAAEGASWCRRWESNPHGE